MVRCIYCRRWTIEKIRVCRWCTETHRDVWNTILPPESTYANTDMTKLLGAHPRLAKQYQQILSWNPDRKLGLLVHGPTGVGKSRCCWTMLRRMHDAGYSVFGIQATALGNKISEAFFAGHGVKLMQTIGDHDIVFIDDIDKIKTTERVECELFALIERLCSEKRLIITTNLCGDAFEAKFTHSIGAPLLRRLHEFCIPIGMHA